MRTFDQLPGVSAEGGSPNAVTTMTQRLRSVGFTGFGHISFCNPDFNPYGPSITAIWSRSGRISQTERRADVQLARNSLGNVPGHRVPFVVTGAQMQSIRETSDDTDHIVASADRAVAVPMYGPDCEMSVFVGFGALADDHQPSPDLVRGVRLLALETHATLTECAFVKPCSPADVLTARERECLLWTARGKTAWEIARIVGRSRGTVNFHLRSAMRKLDAVNKTQAVAIAVSAGLLSGVSAGAP